MTVETASLPHMFRFGLLVGLALLAACAGADDSGQPQSFAAHLNGSYTAGVVVTSHP
jgi:hypothetical protein